MAFLSYEGARLDSQVKTQQATLEQMLVLFELYDTIAGHFPEGMDDGHWAPEDNCSSCFYRSGDVPSAIGEWNAAVDALLGVELGQEGLRTDVWGSAYAYDNNRPPLVSPYWSWLCSLGPDQTLQTDLVLSGDAANFELTNPEPVTFGDDICIFF